MAPQFRIGKRRAVAFVCMDADLVDFDLTYSFESVENGKLMRWTGAKPDRQGAVAVFDYADGKNGTMLVMSESLRDIIR